MQRHPTPRGHGDIKVRHGDSRGWCILVHSLSLSCLYQDEGRGAPCEESGVEGGPSFSLGWSVNLDVGEVLCPCAWSGPGLVYYVLFWCLFYPPGLVYPVPGPVGGPPLSTTLHVLHSSSSRRRDTGSTGGVRLALEPYSPFVPR